MRSACVLFPLTSTGASCPLWRQRLLLFPLSHSYWSQRWPTGWINHLVVMNLYLSSCWTSESAVTVSVNLSVPVCFIFLPFLSLSVSFSRRCPFLWPCLFLSSFTIVLLILKEATEHCWVIVFINNILLDTILLLTWLSCSLSQLVVLSTDVISCAVLCFCWMSLASHSQFVWTTCVLWALFFQVTLQRLPADT